MKGHRCFRPLFLSQMQAVPVLICLDLEIDLGSALYEALALREKLFLKFCVRGAECF
jgi:hypothetical protein